MSRTKHALEALNEAAELLAEEFRGTELADSIDTLPEVTADRLIVMIDEAVEYFAWTMGADAAPINGRLNKIAADLYPISESYR